MKIRHVLAVGALLLAVSAASYAARGFWEEGMYLDDQGNMVGYTTIPCEGREILEGYRTSNYVYIAGGSCDLGYDDPPGGY